MPAPTDKTCPCGLPGAYAHCCGRWHAAFAASGRLQAPTPEALMRSRYTAFVLDHRAHLLATWHPDHRPAAIEPPEPGLQWLGLQVQGSAQHPLEAGQALPAWAQGLSGAPLSAIHSAEASQYQDSASELFQSRTPYWIMWPNSCTATLREKPG